MKILILFATILVVQARIENEEENEISLCVEHKNPFAYSHCIKKRDAACNNGGFCGTCNTNSCQTCSNGNCKTSCNGNACSQCPTGNCCNGENCNACFGRSCCTTQSCNSCVSYCNSGCSSPACRNSCVQSCQNNSCCDRSECFNTCRNQCFGDHCYENCFKQCTCEQPCSKTDTPVLPPPVTPAIIIQPQPTPNHTIIIQNAPAKSDPVNISTVINLKNYIYNKNIIHSPINITNVNHNHINNTQDKFKGEIKDKLKEKCCYVVYPVHCFNINEPPYMKCTQKRKWECSSICTSVVVHVVHVPGPSVPVPVPVKVPYPVKETVVLKQPVPLVMNRNVPVYLPVRDGYRQQCHYIPRYPWISCGNYGVQNCGSCYVCGGQYNPSACSQQSSCSGLCRGGITVTGSNVEQQILRYSPFYNCESGCSIPPSSPYINGIVPQFQVPSQGQVLLSQQADTSLQQQPQQQQQQQQQQ